MLARHSFLDLASVLAAAPAGETSPGNRGRRPRFTDHSYYPPLDWLLRREIPAAGSAPRRA